jgi:O-antigen ligase
MAEAISSELAIDDEEEVGSTISHSTMAKNELLEYGPIRNFENQKAPIYRWVTDTSLGQISYLAGPFFRFFSAGQIFSLIGLSILTYLIIKKKLERRSFVILLSMITIHVIALVMGFSRSLWLGMIAMFVFILFLLPWKKSLRIVLYGIGCISITIILAGTLLPSFYDLVYQRVNSIINPETEEAGQNRFNLINPVFDKISEHPILGSGFGTTVEYDSVVPEKYGTLRVFAFEWSYLDTITEIGILGLLVYLLFIYKIFKQGIQDKLYQDDKILIIGLLAGLFGIVVTNITTPYLNHPMGIGYIVIVMAFIHYLREHYVKEKFQS